MKFKHNALDLRDEKNLIFTAMSKETFYFRMHISKFVLEQNYIPLSAFMCFEYFMLDTVDREVIRNANNNLLAKAQELWVFGPISDGVLAEIKIAKSLGKPIRYFKIIKNKEIKEISKEELIFDEDTIQFKHLV